MIRILQCIGSLEYGGAQSFIMEVYRKIDREKFQFDFIVFEGECKDNYSEIKDLGGIVYECPRYRGTNHMTFVIWWKKFFQEHTDYRILHSHLRSCVSIILPIARKAGCTTIVHSHSTSNGSGAKAIVKAILQYPIRFQADYLFACSIASGQWLFGKTAVRRTNYRTIPNCIDVQRFLFSYKAREQLRNQLQISPDDFVLGHVGRFHQVKNHRFLIDIFKEILKQCSKAKLLLVGDGELLEATRTYCVELGIQDKVIFTGSKHDTAPYYSVMDVFVFPSLWEGVPVSVVEAQASGVNCIISNTITKDVQLTDLVNVISLAEPATVWATHILSKNKPSPRIHDEKKIQLLNSFDSTCVAAELCDFYQKIMGTR